jgi:hypothetical protein
VVELLSLDTKTGFDIPKTFSVGQLSKSHTEELIEATERFDLVVSIVSLHAAAKRMHGKMFYHLGEDNLSYVHDSPLKAAQIPAF